MEINQLVKICGKIKDIKRTGWKYKNVNFPESDADHSFGVALLVMLLTPKHLDLLKSIKLALIHDLPEIYAGDITPHDNMSPETKQQNEMLAINKISQELKYKELTELFVEFEEQKTAEAKWVKALDKLETVMTAKYYDDNHRSKETLINEFSAYAKAQIDKIDCSETDIIKNILNNLTKGDKNE